MEKLKNIAEWFLNFGITLYQVGGSVRDEIMGLPMEDVDVCVVGADTAGEVAVKLEILYNFRHIQNFTPVHGSFPIWIVEMNDGEKYEFAMARKERKTGQTRQEFECEVNNITIEEDLMRRDLDINAIGKNIITGEIVDPFGGQCSIKHKIAHPVSQAFKEDNLRVYRAARFIAKFDLAPTEKLIEYCKELIPTNPVLLSNERVGMELMKMLKTAKKPSLFFNFLRKVGWLEYHFPELHSLIGVPQSPIHHPEGDAYTHTMHCIDAAQGWFYRAVLLCHDLGKAVTTKVNGVDWPIVKEEGLVNINYPEPLDPVKITAHGHEEAGIELTKNMLKRIFFASHETIDQISCLVELHMIRTVISKDNAEKIIRRTIRKLKEYDLKYADLVQIIQYDLMGRPPKKALIPPVLLDELFVDVAFKVLPTMAPIVTGKILVDLGMSPGEEMGKIIKHALELQDRGTLNKDNWQKVLKGAGYKFFNQKTITNGKEI